MLNASSWVLFHVHSMKSLSNYHQGQNTTYGKSCNPYKSLVKYVYLGG